MAHVLDTVYRSATRIQSDPKLVLDNDFMINIFHYYCDKLPAFKEFWELIFKKKQTKAIAHKYGSKVEHFTLLFIPI
jgi:hypothetical protein